MLPDGRLSTTPVPAPFVGARGLPVTKTVDYEDGGIALSDTSRGLLYQRWRARLIGDDVILDAPEAPETVIFSRPGITEISVTFDQNMQPVLAFVDGLGAHLYWYDATAPGFTVYSLGTGIASPRVTLDDKRPTQSGISDVVLAYKRLGQLFIRYQRDRFRVEIDPFEGMPEPEKTITAAQIAASGGLIKIGMNRQWRLQFMFESTQ